MKEYTLKVAQEGIAAGIAFPVSMNKVTGSSVAKDKETELADFERALASLDAELERAGVKATDDSASIYETERLLLKDPDFAEAIRSMIGEGTDAITSVRKIGETLAKELGDNENEYISQRSDDVEGLTARLLDELSGDEKQVLDTPSIIVAEELSPARLSALDRNMILGIVTIKGAPTSHVAILAGDLGIPYYYGSEEAVAAVTENSRLILEDGKLILDPAEGDYADAERRIAEIRAKKKEEAERLQNAERRTRVYANIAGTGEIDGLIASGAEGVGLFRSEYLFLGEEPPSEEDQFEAYRAVAEAMNGKETVIRTMDLGSDKKADWLHMPLEKNPALGCRGLRLSLREEELFDIQLRALLRAAACGNLRIMIPMIASVWEVETARERVEACAKQLDDEGVPYRIPAIGIMVETPAAVMIADKLAEKVDFFSIGTNDLTQYTLALDREAEGLDSYYDPLHEGILRLIERTAEAGHEHGITTAVCGELASNPKAIRSLIERGVDELSVSVSKVEATKLHAADAEEKIDNESGDLSLAAPADGQVIPMEEIPDEAFSSGTLGDCIGILPEKGSIYSPCDGIVTSVAETEHAITFTASDGRSILLHVGIDTVKLQGKGFDVLVEEGQKVEKGDKVMEADLDVIARSGHSTIVITSVIR